jgi:hypothetical protein
MEFLITVGIICFIMFVFDVVKTYVKTHDNYRDDYED